MDTNKDCSYNIHLFKPDAIDGDKCFCGLTNWHNPLINIQNIHDWRKHTSNERALRIRREFKLIKGGKES